MEGRLKDPQGGYCDGKQSERNDLNTRVVSDVTERFVDALEENKQTN